MFHTTRADLRWTAALVITAAAAAGCAHTPSAPFHCDSPPPFHVSLQGAERLNPDPDGNALPTVVRVLQLSGSSRLENAQFNGLWQNPEEALGPDLIRMDEVTVDPGQTSGHWYNRDPKAKYVVAVGIFRQPSGDFWRAAVSLAPVSREQCVPPAGAARSGPPQRTDVQVVFRLEDYRIDALPGVSPRGAR